MARYPTPDKPGFYWGKLVHPAEGTRDGDEARSADWEVVDVFENHNGDAADPEKHMVHVPGIEKAQSIEDFIWGPEVVRPAELK